MAGWSDAVVVKAAKDRRKLQDEHRPEAIRRRLGRGASQSYLGDAVLGAIDGCVTTFAVVAGSSGGGFDNLVIIVLGVANLLADGLSMAVSNYMSAKVVAEELEAARRTEEQHIDIVPEGERQEIRQIYAQKGLSGEILDEVVDVITSNRRVWVDTMIAEELHMQAEQRNPLRAGVSTFFAFLLVGVIPLLPYLFPLLPVDGLFVASAILTGIGFLVVGIAKGVVLHRQVWRSALETLLTGGAAAAVAYGVGFWLRQAFGTS